MASEGWHYIRRNETTRQPRRHIFLDCEARSDRTRTGHEQTWRCAVAIYRDAPKDRQVKEETRVYSGVRSLWNDVTAFIPRRGRAILWTHNLGYDIRISKALTTLVSLGWRVDAHNLTPQGTWIAWRRGDQSLTMVDSAAVFPVSVQQMAKWFMTTKLPLPAEDAPYDQWVARAARDCQILRDAVVSYLDRIEAMDLGNWQPTGTGQSWAAFRHKHLTHQMLVHWDADARAAERRAMWTGRCEAYWRGRLHHVRVDEWDMTLAYPRIALTHAVPVALSAAITTDAELRRYLAREGYVVLAEVDVSTSEPLVPTERDGRILWPVGRFRTTLWSPELQLLVERGAEFTLVRGWAYKAEPALASWAEWIIEQLSAPDVDSPAWWKAIVKHWARALIGRLAMVYRDWEHVHSAGRPDIRRALFYDADTGQRGESVQIGRDVFVATETVEWSQSMPAITGYIMSAVRAILARLLLAAGVRTALYADTDSLLVTGEHYDQLAEIAASHPVAGLRLKRSWESVEIRGPRQIITGQRVRISGVPVRAERLADGSLRGEVWQTLASAITDRAPSVVRIRNRHWHLRAVDHRRDTGPDGWTVPYSIDRPPESYAPEPRQAAPDERREPIEAVA